MEWGPQGVRFEEWGNNMYETMVRILNVTMRSTTQSNGEQTLKERWLSAQYPLRSPSKHPKSETQPMREAEVEQDFPFHPCTQTEFSMCVYVCDVQIGMIFWGLFSCCLFSHGLTHEMSVCMHVCMSVCMSLPLLFSNSSIFIFYL